MSKIYSLILLLSMTSCTYNVSMIHTEGHAEDVLDSTQDAKSDLSPSLTIPTV